MFMTMCFLAGSMVLFAQDPETTMNTNNSYPAYAAPSTVQLYFARDYPAATNVTWKHENDWWKASYHTNGRYSHVYYTESGNSFVVNTPVAKTAVPDDIFTSANNLWAEDVYSITTMTGLEGKTVYHVHLLENGERTSRWLSDEGKEIPVQYLERGYYDTHMNTYSNLQKQNM